MDERAGMFGKSTGRENRPAEDMIKEALEVSKNADVIIIDTAGRLHNKAHLMDELSKIKKVIQKVIPEVVITDANGTLGVN